MRSFVSHSPATCTAAAVSTLLQSANITELVASGNYSTEDTPKRLSTKLWMDNISSKTYMKICLMDEGDENMFTHNVSKYRTIVEWLGKENRAREVRVCEACRLIHLRAMLFLTTPDKHFSLNLFTSPSQYMKFILPQMGAVLETTFRLALNVYVRISWDWAIFDHMAGNLSTGIMGGGSDQRDIQSTADVNLADRIAVFQFQPLATLGYARLSARLCAHFPRRLQSNELLVMCVRLCICGCIHCPNRDIAVDYLAYNEEMEEFREAKLTRGKMQLSESARQKFRIAIKASTNRGNFSGRFPIFMQELGELSLDVLFGVLLLSPRMHNCNHICMLIVTIVCALLNGVSGLGEYLAGLVQNEKDMSGGHLNVSMRRGMLMVNEYVGYTLCIS